MSSRTFREAAAAFRRTPLLTGLSAAMVGLALFVVGLFAVAAYNLRLALESVEERVEVVAYLSDAAHPNEIESAHRDLSSFPEVQEVRYVTKDEAMRRAREELPEIGELSGALDVNPFPASLEIALQPGSMNAQSIQGMAEYARAYAFVEDVGYGREWVDKLFTLRQIGAVTAVVIGIAFAAVAALIIGTAIRIAIFARRDEIYIMKLVGAKNGFIQRPFLLEGAFTGLIGGGIATFMTWVTFRAVFRFLFTLSWIPGSWILVGIATGGLFGMLASAGAVRRHLREI